MDFCKNFIVRCIKAYLILVVLVSIFAKQASAIEASCDYYQEVVPGNTYYVYNTEYPNPYTRARSCRWYARSTTNIRLTCQIFSLPASANCAGDRVSVSPSGNFQLTDAQNYCGTGTFNVTSTGNSINIVLTSYAGTTGGRFLCSLQATTTTIPSCNCGWKNPARIVGGTETGTNEFPPMAGIVDLNQRLLYCGATIISTKHAITGAHCFKADTPVNRLALLVGEHDTSTGTETAATALLPFSDVNIHPLYDLDTLKNDIAVVTVLNAIVYSSTVGPACLPFQHASSTYVGTALTALGWGSREFAGARSDALQKVPLDVIQISSCQQVFPDVTNNQLCTYTPGKDSCQFDSGGPLFWQNPNTMRLVLSGVISYGVGCDANTPSVNTRVGGYVNWIVSVTPGVNLCRVE